jgi:hypothetical protein
MTAYSTYELPDRDDAEEYLFDFDPEEVEWDEGYETSESSAE